MPPLQAEPFWYFGDNVRFREGMPETVGLFARAKNFTTGNPVTINISDGIGTLFGDGGLVIVGHGLVLSVVNLVTGTVTNVTASQAGADGRWWFVPVEDYVICGRANLDGRTYTLNRSTLVAAILPNSPVGGMGAGVVSDIFMVAGTIGVAGDGPKMVVRWSARATDPSSGGVSGPFGFEDWTPSDVNASGEFLLDEGSEIRGGAALQMGFAVWTDTRMILLTPRTDTYVFTKRAAASRGLLASHTFCEADGRIWWYDQASVLNVFDGGGARQIINPMQHVSVELIENEDLGLLSMSANPEHGEIVLHYPGVDGRFRDLIYNYEENAWYQFTLDRIAMTDAQGSRPSIGIDLGGRLFFYDLHQALPFALVNPIPPASPDVVLPPAVSPSPTVVPVIRPSLDPEPYAFRLMTGWIGGDSTALDSLRSRNVVVSHTMVQVNGGAAYNDELRLTVCSYGALDLNEVPTVDDDLRPVGDMVRKLRAGGKALQFVLSADNIRTKLRFAPLDVEADVSGKR